MKIIRMPEYPCGISNGLSIPCSKCHELPRFDYNVTDEIWDKIVPDGFRRGVICLYCLDLLAWKKGIDISRHLIFVQFTGVEKTIVLKPESVYLWNAKKFTVKK